MTIMRARGRVGCAGLAVLVLLLASACGEGRSTSAACERYQEVPRYFAELEAADAEELEDASAAGVEQFRGVADRLARAAEVAPDEVRFSAEQMADLAQAMTAEMEALDGDPANETPEEQERLEQLWEAFESQSDRVEDWVESSCGFSLFD
jgi:hypothetical protein